MELLVKDESPANDVNGKQSSPPTKMSGIIVISSVVASIGGILFGYDIGIISGAMLQLRDTFPLTSFLQDVVTSSVLVGALLASLVAGSIIDHFGRRISIFLTGLLFVVGTIILTASINLTMLIIGRTIVGFGVALSTAAECTYISEIAPPRWRGLLVSLNEFGITVGFLLAYISSYLLISNPIGWRIMFCVALVPAIIQVFGVIFLPPSPHYLALKGDLIKAELSLKRLHGGEVDTKVLLDEIELAIHESKNSTIGDLFRKKDALRYRMFVAIILVLLQQFTGNANVLYYAPIIFQKFGFQSHKLSTLVSISLGAVKVVTSAIALSLVDRFGRLRFLCIGAAVMGVSLSILAIVSLTCESSIQKNNSTDGPYEFLINFKNETTADIEFEPVSLQIRIVSVVSLMGFICGYQFSFGICTWLVLSEIFPTPVRGRGVSIATSVNWAGNLIITITFMQSTESLGIEKIFIIYACACFLSVIFIYFFVPETKQKTLEEISILMNKGPDFGCFAGLNKNSYRFRSRTNNSETTLINNAAFKTIRSNGGINN